MLQGKDIHRSTGIKKKLSQTSSNIIKGVFYRENLYNDGLQIQNAPPCDDYRATNWFELYKIYGFTFCEIKTYIYSSFLETFQKNRLAKPTVAQGLYF